MTFSGLSAAERHSLLRQWLRRSRAKVLRLLLLGWSLYAVCSMTVHAATAAAEPGKHERAFVRALELFDAAKSADDYRASAQELESIVADGIHSGAVYYNLGNAWYRAGEYGRAILNYRKAVPYRPRDPYLQANLQQALAAAPGRLPEQPSPWYHHVLFWTTWLAWPAKIQVTALLLSSAAAVSVIAVLIRKSRLHVLSGLLITGAIAIGVDAALSHPQRNSRAVITQETMARKGTGKDHEAAFDQPLKDGAEFKVLSETRGWVFGHFEGIGDGWVRSESVAR